MGSRSFFPPRQRFPRRHHDHWFQQNFENFFHWQTKILKSERLLLVESEEKRKHLWEQSQKEEENILQNIPDENFWMDTWDMPQNQIPERPPPWWNQHRPEQERPYNVSFDNYTRGSCHRRPYRSRPFTRSKGRGNFQNRSSSPFLINVASKKTFEKVKPPPEDSKKFKQNKGNTATLVKKDVPSKVKPEDSHQPDKESPSQTDSVVSPEAVAEEESPSGIAKIPPHTQNEDIVSQQQLQDKLKDCEATEDLLSQTVSILSPGISTEDKTPSYSAEDLQNIEQKDSVLQQASQSAQDSSHVFSSTAVEIPFLSENANDDQFERREEIELTETSAKQQNDIDDPQAYVVAPALDSSSLPSILNYIHCESVLVRGKDTGLTETSAKQQNDTDDSQSYDSQAPALDSSSFTSTLNDIGCVPVLVREKDTGLTEISAKQQNDTDDSQAYDSQAPALDSSGLTSTLNDIPSEPVLVREKDTGLTETSAKQQNDTDDSQGYVVALALDSSSLTSTLNDIRCVPVLVRRKVIGLAENQRAWAPEDYQEPPWNVNQAGQYLKVSECYKDSVSTSISSNGKHNIESLVKSKSSSPKINHSINSKHSSTNQTSRDLRCPSPRSYVGQECSSRSYGKRDLSTERQDRNSKLSCRREHSSGSSHKQEASPQREKHTSKSPYRQEQSSQKRDCSPETCLMQEHGVKSIHKRKFSSILPPKKKQHSQSQKLDRWKQNKSGRSCCCHCNYHCQQSCRPSQESLWHGCCSPSYLTCKIEHLNVSKEIRNVYGMPYHLSPERSFADKKEIRESTQVVEPKIPVIEKKKRATSRTGRKTLKSLTKKQKRSSPCHLNAEEETNSSVPSWSPKDRSAAVLARKEEFEQAYLQVLLNFGVMAIMLVEKEPCMLEAMSSALRANLRKIGNYYECLLKNYIDSLTEAS